MKLRPDMLRHLNAEVSKLRHLEILNLLSEEPVLSVKDLAFKVDVSSSTIRRDLNFLAEQGLIRRVFGGAILRELYHDGEERPFELREVLHGEQKDLIGKSAAEMVQDDDVIFVDGGTTTQFIVPYLADRNNLTVVTCGLNVACAMRSMSNTSLILVGGHLHADSYSVVGPLADEAMELFKIRCNKAFISSAGVSAEHGLTNRIIERIPLKRKAIEISHQVIAVADGSKVGLVTLGQIAPIESLDRIITDTSAPRGELDCIRASGVRVVIAEAP